LLRATAAIAVVTHHIPLFANGAWGVDLFFAISGFIMCHVTESSGRNFFAKRFIRVVPLYWGATLAIFGVALVAPSLLNSTTDSVSDLVKSLLFIPFVKAGHVQPVLYLGWTLNYEIFFYLLFAASLAFSHRYRALICSALILLIVGSCYLFSYESVPLRFFTDPILIEFVYGMLCFYLYRGIPKASRAAARGAWTLAGVIMLACLPLHPDTSERILDWGAPAALGLFCIIHGLAGITLPRVLVLLGDASYSLYLLHLYVLRIVYKLVPAYSGSDRLAYAVGLAAALACCRFAVLVYSYIERPVTNFLRRAFLTSRGVLAQEGA
jgi:peptidoglycan/LPS O-acetylase OafA/YrhL